MFAAIPHRLKLPDREHVPPRPDSPPADPGAGQSLRGAGADPEPCLTAGYADRLADLLAHLRPGGRVLCLGGPGVAASASRMFACGTVVVLTTPPPADCCPPAMGEVAALPFPAGTFDAVLVLDAFFGEPRLCRAFREVARVLAPGGVLQLEMTAVLGDSAADVAFGRLSRAYGAAISEAGQVRRAVLAGGLRLVEGEFQRSAAGVDQAGDAVGEPLRRVLRHLEALGYDRRRVSLGRLRLAAQR